MRKINTFLSLGFNKQLMFIEAFILSGYYRFAMIYLPFKYLKNQMGIPKTESPSQVDDPAYVEAKRIRSIVLLACKYTPWESKCLVRALLVQHFLKRKKIATTIYLGVNKDGLNNMKAHAWIRCGEMIVTGQYEKDHFIQVATFSNESLIAYAE